MGTIVWYFAPFCRRTGGGGLSWELYIRIERKEIVGFQFAAVPNISRLTIPNSVLCHHPYLLYDFSCSPFLIIIFISRIYTFQVPENATLNSFVGEVKANDSDGSPNLLIRYRLHASSEDPFSNRNLGIITVNGSLDREKKANYTFVITAIDEKHNDTATLIILVEDVNDNSPKFSKSIYDAHITENIYVNTFVLKVSATDDDLGSNAEITYEFQGTSGPFVINGTNGDVMVGGPIDREKNSSYSLVVFAKDGKHTGNATLSIRVTDVNDNAPVFSEMSYVANISENATLNTFVLMVSATDADIGSNAEITYEFEGRPRPFVINGTNGDVVVGGPIDREKNSSYSLVVFAKDGKHTGNATLSIRVTDVNDNAPVFSEMSYVANISENATLNTFVLMVSATDADIGSNAEITYEFEGRPRPFVINGTNGDVVVGGPIDREKNSSYSLVVFAKDGKHTGNATLSIRVTDVNDNAPVFSEMSYVAKILENATLNAFVLMVSATDADTGSNAEITYEFAGGSGGPFNISGTNGSITVGRALDRERNSSYNLVVLAKDAKHIGNATIAITVSDVNDNPPVFSNKSYTCSITENVPPGKSVFSVSASDRDVGSNAKIRYTFANEASGSFFMNETNGLITVANQSRIDRERESNYSLKVVASDGRWNDTASLTIVVLDMNDNTPVYYHFDCNGTASLDISIVQRENSNSPGFPCTIQGVKIIRINMTASDRDIDNNSLIVYSIKSASEHFNITEHGNVYIPNQLQHGKEYHLELIAEDPLHRNRSSPCNITIGVKGNSTTGGLWDHVLLCVFIYLGPITQLSHSENYWAETYKNWTGEERGGFGNGLESRILKLQR